MIATLKTTDTGPAPEDQHTDRPRKRHDPEDRLHVSALLFGLIDARASHVDFLDTSGGQELQRWYHRHHPGRRHVGQ